MRAQVLGAISKFERLLVFFLLTRQHRFSYSVPFHEPRVRG